MMSSGQKKQKKEMGGGKKIPFSAGTRAGRACRIPMTFQMLPEGRQESRRACHACRNGKQRREALW